MKHFVKILSIAAALILISQVSSPEEIKNKPSKTIKRLPTKEKKNEKIPPNAVKVMINGSEWAFYRDSMQFDNSNWNRVVKLALSKKTTIGEFSVDIPKESTVIFFTDGRVQEAVTASVIKSGSINLKGKIEFRNSGAIAKAYLSENIEFKGLKLRKNSLIIFHDNPASSIIIDTATLGSDAKIGPVLIGKDCELHFANSAELKLTYARPISDEKIGDYRFRRSTSVFFHEQSGKIKSGIISLNTLIDGKLYPPNTYVEFSEDDKLIKAVVQRGENN